MYHGDGVAWWTEKAVMVAALTWCNPLANYSILPKDQLHIAAFVWRNWRNLRKLSISIALIRAQTPTQKVSRMWSTCVNHYTVICGINLRYQSIHKLQYWHEVSVQQSTILLRAESNGSSPIVSNIKREVTSRKQMFSLFHSQHVSAQTGHRQGICKHNKSIQDYWCFDFVHHLVF